MRPTTSFNASPEDGQFQVLWEDGERALCRQLAVDKESVSRNVLALRLTVESPLSASVDRLVNEYELRDHLDSAWAARPLELMRQRDRTLLLLEDPGGEPLDRHLGEPMEVPRFLQLAISIAAALRQVHQRGLVHKDLKPGHILVDGENVYLTGFGLASRLPRERQSPSPPEFIVGTLAYMAPEQTGRMNRSIDSRSDLYSLGVTFYQMLTGVLPFMASHPMEWIHCHVARTPVPPHQRVADLSSPISHIVMKLLAKTAEERYQTAAGVERDLKRCLAAWRATGGIDTFLPGETDTPDHLSTPETLYGREPEIAGLLEAYERVATTGTPELMLVCGYSGIGKSSVVHELHKAIVPTHGLFAAGKFDQQQRDIPYRALAQAFQGLIRDFMGSRSDAELEGWRGALSEALGSHGRRVAELVPELELIIGKQPLAGDLPARQSHRLFQIALRRFVGAFAQAEHPLVLFLDDLHWVDAATLDLLEELMFPSDLHHLLVIGAYRDNEIDPTHPLMRKLEAIRHFGAKVGQITLTPLGREHLEELVGHALRCAPTRAAPLAQLVHEKTGGNPFFASRFLSTLADENLLAFDATAGEWCWDLARIRAKGYTENVVDLMVDRVSHLPAQTQTALKQLACLGNAATTAMLSTALETSQDHLHAALWEAVRHDLVERLDGSYRFVHDRVQEATYSSIPADQRARAHLLIGRLIAAQTPPEKQYESIFEIVNQLNRCLGLITAAAERQQLAAFNLTAGRRASAATAFAAALSYFATGRDSLTEQCWESHRELIFKLELHRAECELLTGAFAEAEIHFTSLSARATGASERAAVARVGIDLYSLINQHTRATGVGIDYLKHVGISLSPQPTDEEARHAYQQIWAELRARTTEELIELPLMTDPESLATLDVLNRLSSPAQFTDLNLYTLAACRMLSLTLERGNSDATAVAYSRLGMVAGRRFGEYENARHVGQLAYELVERRGLRRFQAGVYLNFGNLIMPWTRHIRDCCELIGRAFAAAQTIGDLMYAAICLCARTVNHLTIGDALADIQRECESSLAFMQKLQVVPGVDVVSVALATVRMLRGSTASFGKLDDGLIDEQQIERGFANSSELTGAQCWYWVSKLRARFAGGDYATALDAASRARPLLSRSIAIMQAADYYFYTALSHAAYCNSLPVTQRAPHLEALAFHHRQLTDWAATCPENFADRAALVGAEAARLEGRELEAERQYAQSIRSARANGFIHNEALAYELASNFHAGRGLEDIAEMHLSKARNVYLRWGAVGKVRQLEALHPFLRSGPPAGPGGPIGVPVDQLDLATVIKVSQTVSSEIVLEKLIDTLMRTAIEQAGAQRGVLVVWRDGEMRCVAAGSIRNDAIVVELRDAPMAQTLLSQSIAQYVLRTRDPVILDDATAEHPFSADPYIRQRRARSVLCLPLITQAKLGGLLYLENNLAPRVFVQARAAVLKLLASQAAIALENAGLYRDVKRAEEQTREAQMELRRASDKLAQATQAASLSELSASIAHEVNQPLAAIVANSHACYRWLSAAAPNIERAKITAERITRDANSAADIVSRIRALFSRTPSARSYEDINGLINGVCRLLAEEIEQKDCRINTHLEPGLPLVALDRVQVQQVFVNLIRNGIEAMEAVVGDARTLQIRSCRDGSRAIRVEVRDAGTGFNEPERAFEPFFTTKQNGMGMGLAICRSIVESHGGRLWAADNEPLGATVAFTLPLAQPPGP
jgi:predicted ATPase/signal transduction histidine kinase